MGRVKANKAQIEEVAPGGIQAAADLSHAGLEEFYAILYRSVDPDGLLLLRNAEPLRGSARDTATPYPPPGGA